MDDPARADPPDRGRCGGGRRETLCMGSPGARAQPAGAGAVGCGGNAPAQRESLASNRRLRRNRGVALILLVVLDRELGVADSIAAERVGRLPRRDVRTARFPLDCRGLPSAVKRAWLDGARTSRADTSHKRGRLRSIDGGGAPARNPSSSLSTPISDTDFGGCRPIQPPPNRRRGDQRPCDPTR